MVRNRRGRWVAALIVILLVVAGLLWWHPWRNGGGGGGGQAEHARERPAGGRRAGFAGANNQPQAVRIAAVVAGDLPIVRNALGTVTPLATVTVRTQIAGMLTQIAFKEGQIVKAGDLLAVVDPRPYEISLRQAQGTLQRDQALLAEAELDLARYAALLKQDSIARQTYEAQVSLVAQDKGTVIADQAQVDTFKLDIAYCHITAPVSGRVGLRQVDIGNYVQTSDANGIVVLTQLNPISVVFTLPEDDVALISQRLASGAQLSASAYDRSNTTQLAVGTLQTIDNQVDTTTGTFKLRAGFDNSADTLFPSQFVNIRLLVDALHNATIVPSSAVLTGSQGPFVYVAKPDSTVTVRKVVPGPVDGERTAITSGLQIGEKVVIDGTDRLREGAKIVIPAEHPVAASGASGAAAAAGEHRQRHGGAGAASGASGAAERRHHRDQAAAASS